MRTLSHTLAASLSLLVFIPTSFAAERFPYRQSIQVPPLGTAATAGVELNPQVHNLDRTYWILNGNGMPVPVRVLDTQTNILRGARILSGPDASEEASPVELAFDGNPETVFKPVVTTEHRFVVQVEEPAAPQELSYQLKSGSVDFLRFRHGESPDSLSLSFIGAPTGTRMPIFSSPATVFEITLETPGELAIGELQLLSTSKRILFTAEPGEHYVLAYGSTAEEGVPPSDETLDLAGALKAELGFLEYTGPQGADADGDSIPDAADNCPREANTDQRDGDGDGVGDLCDAVPTLPNTRQPDSDGDGITDDADNCPKLPNTDQRDIDGDGRGWVCDDDDRDGIPNSEDNCVGVPNPRQERTGGSALGNACKGDSDGDGVPPEKDNCSNFPNPDQADGDGDGYGDACDVCPLLHNPDQRDTDRNGIGDACQGSRGQGEQDTDRDGVENKTDNCAFATNSNQQDGDGDGIGDVCDNCPEIPNPLQRDSNTDGKGDACSDTDKDGVFDAEDNCPAHRNPQQEDNDGNGVGNLCEDDDGDRIANIEDNCPSTPNATQEDRDSDGRGDACDDTDNRLQTDRKPWVSYVLGASLALLTVLIGRQKKQSVKQQHLPHNDERLP